MIYTMTYYESAEDVTISRSRALKELADHGLPASEYDLFLAEVGDKEVYDAQEVLRWIGY